MEDNQIIPAIIADSQEDFTGRICRVRDYVSIIQLDFMDGKFVPSRSIDFDFSVPEYGGAYEAHLMVADPGGWIEGHGHKVDTILAPIEASDNPGEVIDAISGLGKKPGFVLNPETPLKSIMEYVDDIEQVLIMTVNPGFYGSPFLPEMVGKIRELRETAPGLDIEVDGGITPDTIRQVFDAGANMFVSGSYIVKADDPGDSVKNLKLALGVLV
ncbi:MAG: ribulose-phosphate 3-epimerase [Candidatus Altiarchaeota archaeon]